MEKEKELFDEVAAQEEINEVDGEPIYHANEGEGVDEGESTDGNERAEEE